jgi:hypothetical protein
MIASGNIQVIRTDLPPDTLPTSSQPTTAAQRILWVALVGTLVVLPNLFAIRQFRDTGGYLFYSNAFDESTYLSYDGARLARSVTHSATYLVVALHNLGVSGGYMNLVFDVIVPVVTVVMLRRIAIALGFSALESIVYPFLIIAMPVLFGYANPYYTRLYNLNYYSKGLSWITLPQGYYPPFFRTPEPQLSLAVVAISSYVAIRRHSYLIALAVSPMVYPFVGIPYMFVVLGLMIHDWLGGFIGSAVVRVIVALLASYIATAGLILALYLVFVRGTALADFLPLTHMPLLSGTGAVGILVWFFARSGIEPRYRLPVLFLAVAPTAVANTQLISGFLQTPHNLEQNFGVVVLAIVCVFAIRAVSSRPWIIMGVATASCWLLSVYSSHIFVVNASMLQRTPLSDDLLDVLRREPESLVIADPDLADLFSLVAPRVHFSALARSQTLRTQDDGSGEPTTSDRFQNYLCVKQLLSHRDGPESITAAFGVLDRGFRYLNQDFPLIHLNRKNAFTQYFDPTAEPQHCSSRQLKIFPAFVLSGELGQTQAPQTVVTPKQQWAYASLKELDDDSKSGSRSQRLVDLRATLTVTQGCVGVGVLTPDKSAFVAEASIASGESSRVADLLFEGGDRPHWLVVRNCSPSGSSEGVVHAVQLFVVESVTTRSVSAVLP